MEALQYELPDKYRFDYMIHKLSKESGLPHDYFWNMDYIEFTKELMFYKFDSFLIDEYKKNATKS